jgi:dolichol-phosphate mannosyltransferase
MTAIALFAGVQLIVLGIIGEYLGRLVQEAKGRPLFLIDRIATGGADHPVPLEFSRMSPAARAELLAGFAMEQPQPPEQPAASRKRAQSEPV